MRKTLLAATAALAMFVSVNLQKGSVFPYAGRHEAYLLKNSSACQILSCSLSLYATNSRIIWMEPSMPRLAVFRQRS